MDVLRIVLSTALLLGLGGCAPLHLDRPFPETDDMPEAAFDVSKGQGGGVAVPGSAWSLTSDNRAFRAGDVLTVVLEESTQASKQSGTNLGKNSQSSLKSNHVFNAVVPTNSNIEMNRNFKGNGSSSQQNALRGSVSVIVQRVLTNGLLQVRGEKRLTLNQGEEIVHLSGYVRILDIDPSNRVSSQQIANARIRYSGRGALADTSQPGWLTRFFNNSWMPL